MECPPEVAATGKSPSEPGPPKPQPGEPDWIYVQDPVDIMLVRTVVPFWDKTEFAYTETLKHVFREVRQEREEILR